MSREYTLQQLADLVGGWVEGDPQLSVRGFNGIEYAGPTELTFVLSTKQLPLPADCKAAACIVPEDAGPQDIATIVSDQPSVAAARIHTYMLARPFVAGGVHPSAVIGRECRIPAEVTIGPLACLGDGVVLGEQVTIGAGVVVGDGTVIGKGSVIHANATIAEHCIIGKHVIIHHGAVIGSDGFGFATDKNGCHHKKPQVGTVQIDDDVAIGANACVDRAAFGTTWIKSGTQIDNLVMVGHNVAVGENSILVAQAGIAGSTTLGRNVVLGAKTGVAGHLHLGDRVMAAAMSGIHNNQPADAKVGGVPAFAIKQWGKATAVYNRLPEMARELRRLHKEVERLSRFLAQTEDQRSEEQ